MTRYPVGKTGLCLLAGLLPAFAQGPGGKTASGAAVVSGNSAQTESTKSSKPPAGMRVEEPGSAAGSESGPGRGPLGNRGLGLTETQKAAFRERKEKMEGMIALIQAKRRAMRDAGPEEKALLARELHSLILERADAPADPESAPAARLEGISGPALSESAAENRAAPAERRERRDAHEAREMREGRARSAEEAAARREEMRQRRLEHYRNQRRTDKQ